MQIGEYRAEDLPALMRIWNRVVEDGMAFPEEAPLAMEEMAGFARQQSFVGVAREGATPVGLYILHPNGIGRKSHIANASYAVDADRRGCGIGKALVAHSLQKAKELGYVGMQFNAVVAGNRSAIAAYEGAGFRRIGCIEDGFRLKSGELSDMYIYFYHF